MSVNNPSKTDAAAIEAAKEAAKQQSFVKTVGNTVDTAKEAAAKNPDQKSPLSKQDQENIELIKKNPKAVAQINAMLQDPAIQEAFCYSDNFRSTLLANAKDGFPGKSVQDLAKTATNEETQKDIKETKEALNNMNAANAKYDNEKQRKYFEEKKKIQKIDDDAKQAIERIKNVFSGLFNGDRACMTDAMVTLVGMGSSKLGKFGGAFQLISGFLGKDRFASYLAGDFSNKLGQDDNSAENTQAALNTASAGNAAMKALAMSGNGGRVA